MIQDMTFSNSFSLTKNENFLFQYFWTSWVISLKDIIPLEMNSEED